MKSLQRDLEKLNHIGIDKRKFMFDKQLFVRLNISD